jgi:hypothetical protein
MDWLRRWDIWGVVVGVLGIAVAAYTFYVTDKVGRISYRYETQKVFDPANLSGFTLIDAASEPIKQPVFATDLVIWNSGDLSLSENSDRVREPIKVSIDDGVIHYFILSRVNVVAADNYRVLIASDKKSLSISWRYFDPPQGIRLTIVHSNSASPKVTVFGRFFETSLLDRSEPARKTTSPRDERIFAGVFFALSLLLLVAVGYLLLRRKKRGLEMTKLEYTMILLILFQCGLGGLLFFKAYFPNIPPV